MERSTESTVPAFATFVFAHGCCGVGPSEFRLDGDSLACRCQRCDEIRVFGPAERGESAR